MGQSLSQPVEGALGRVASIKVLPDGQKWPSIYTPALLSHWMQASLRMCDFKQGQSPQLRQTLKKLIVGGNYLLTTLLRARQQALS